MLIFIDESGTFVVPENNGWSVCCVAALVIPSANYSEVIHDFETLKNEWGVVRREVKGRELGEIEIASVIRLLNKFDVLLQVVAIDMGLETCAGVFDHKLRQAEKIMENITHVHRPELADSFRQLQSRIRALPDQLYTQATLMTQLVGRLLQDMTLYYAQRQPKELDTFKWIIDAKDKNKLTEHEVLWRGTVKPYLEGSFPPLYRLRGADYSAFHKFTGTSKRPPRHLRSKMKGTPVDYIRIDKIMKDMRFEQSENEPGLQLVDIVCNACKRALNGKLERTGWEFIGSLMVQAQKNQQEIPLVNLSHRGHIPVGESIPYYSVIATVKCTAKRMLITR